MFVRVQVPPRVLKEIVIDYLIVCYGFFITYFSTPISGINNGFGIFTGMSSDELLLEIKPE